MFSNGELKGLRKQTTYDSEEGIALEDITHKAEGVAMDDIGMIDGNNDRNRNVSDVLANADDINIEETDKKERPLILSEESL